MAFRVRGSGVRDVRGFGEQGLRLWGLGVLGCGDLVFRVRGSVFRLW